MVIEVWKVVEVSKLGRPMTLNAKWRGGRALQVEEWMMSEPFTRRLGNRPGVTQQGFWAFPTADAARAFLNAYCDGKHLALVVAKARGVTPHVDGTILCHELKITKTVVDRPAV